MQRTPLGLFSKVEFTLCTAKCSHEDEDYDNVMMAMILLMLVMILMMVVVQSSNSQIFWFLHAKEESGSSDLQKEEIISLSHSKQIN